MSKEYPTNGERIMSVTDAIDAIDAHQKVLEKALSEVTALWHKIPTDGFPDDFEHWTYQIDKSCTDLMLLMSNQCIALHKRPPK
jgi:hypothetical protein